MQGRSELMHRLKAAIVAPCKRMMRHMRRAFSRCADAQPALLAPAH